MMSRVRASLHNNKDKTKRKMMENFVESGDGERTVNNLSCSWERDEEFC